jgi:hypothetical protein
MIRDLRTWLSCWTWLRQHSLHPHENFADKHCWWHANTDLTGQSVSEAQRMVLHYAHERGMPFEFWRALVADKISKAQIAVAVEAMSHWYKDGLIILHGRVAAAWLFVPGCEAQYISMTEAGEWKQQHAGHWNLTRPGYNNPVLGKLPGCPASDLEPWILDPWSWMLDPGSRFRGPTMPVTVLSRFPG